MRVTCAFLLILLVAGGCGRAARQPPRVDLGNELRLAREAIRHGQTRQAMVHLDKARVMYRGEQPQIVTLLMAEARLRDGEVPEALALAQQVLAEDPLDPAANEVSGKALLKLGRFRDAELKLLAAQQAYRSTSAEYFQLEDLVNLSRGLGAYADADPDVAQRYWDAIEDPQLRFALDKALREQIQGSRIASR